MWMLLLSLLLVPLSASAELCRVHTLPDASVAVTCPADTPSHKAGLPFVDVPREEIQSLDRTKRHAWRVQGDTVKVDGTVPDRPKSKESRRTETCVRVQGSVFSDPLLKELCATF